MSEEIVLKALPPLADSFNIRMRIEKDPSAIVEFKKTMADEFRKGRF